MVLWLYLALYYPMISATEILSKRRYPVMKPWKLKSASVRLLIAKLVLAFTADLLSLAMSGQT
jgi:hypothetical protein